jgi:hypothetical protein
MFTPAGDKTHDIIRYNILKGNLSNMDKRIFFDNNFKTFVFAHFSPSMAGRSLYEIQKFYDINYKKLVLDFRFEIRIKSDNNIGIYATVEVQNIGPNIFVGDFTNQLSFRDAKNHPSCVERLLLERSSNNNSNSSWITQYWTLVGSIALLNHACNHCAKVKPFDNLAGNEVAHYNSCFRVISQKETIHVGEEICISYSDDDDLIQYTCSICNN